MSFSESIICHHREKVQTAWRYFEKGKQHTAAIILVETVKFLSAVVSNGDEDARVLNKKIAINTQLKDEWIDLVTSTKVLLYQVRDCKRADDLQVIAKTKALFDMLFPYNNFQNDDGNSADDTECSCDDCHNGTCSTYGPPDGCRVARTRD